MTNYVKHKMRGKKIICTIGWVLLGIMAACAFALVIGYGLMCLWNWLMPEIFGLNIITYWQAVGLFILSKVLFGGFGGHGSKKSKRKSRRDCRRKESNGLRADINKWKHYDEFWKAEGEQAYLSYIERADKENRRNYL